MLKTALTKVLTFIRRRPAVCVIVLFALALTAAFVITNLRAQKNISDFLVDEPGHETTLMELLTANNAADIYYADGDYPSATYQSWHQVLTSPVVCVEALPPEAEAAKGWLLPPFEVVYIFPHDLRVSGRSVYTCGDEAYAVLKSETNTLLHKNVYRFTELTSAQLEELCRKAARLTPEDSEFTISYTSLEQLAADGPFGPNVPAALPKNIKFEGASYESRSDSLHLWLSGLVCSSSIQIFHTGHAKRAGGQVVSLDGLSHEDFTAVWNETRSQRHDVYFSTGEMEIRVFCSYWRDHTLKETAALYATLLSFCAQEGE